MGIVAAIAGSALGSVGSSLINANAASSASAAQIQAEQQASAQLQKYYNLGSGYLSPFANAGPQALTQLQTATGTGTGGNPQTAQLTAPFQPTMAQLQATPGYQFTLGQGLKATQNSLAAQGLGGSGQATAGAANYASGLASNTYQQQFQNYLNQNSQIFNMLNTQTQTGLNASSNLANLGMQAGGAQAQTMVGAGNAQAAGILGQGAAYSQGLQGLGNSGINYLGLNALLNNQTAPTSVGNLQNYTAPVNAGGTSVTGNIY